MLIVVRHGSTPLNEGGNGNGEDGGEKLRGWLPIPLDLKGMRQAKEVAARLKAIGNVKTIFCSDLPRAVQTAHEIASVKGMVITPGEDLRDWNYGDYAGQSVKKTLPILDSYMAVPTRKTPNGESFQSFLDRAMPFIKKHVESSEIAIAVTHNRTVTLVQALLESKGKKPDMDSFKQKGPLDPGEYFIIKSDWTVFKPK